MKIKVAHYRISWLSELRPFSRARNAARQWAARKLQLADAYIDALKARRKAQSKAIQCGALIEAKAVHADGKQTSAVLTPERLQANVARAAELGAGDHRHGAGKGS